MRIHSAHAALADEVHARPPLRIDSPAQVSHAVMLSGESAGDAERMHLGLLCEQRGLPPPPGDCRQYFAQKGPFALRWERHTEFSSWTFVDQGANFDSEDPFGHRPMDDLPVDWLGALPGELIACVHVALLPPEAAEPHEKTLKRLFERGVGGDVAGGAARFWTDLRVCEGATRFLVHDRTLSAGLRGRTVQRLLEIETYRVLALLGFPLTQRFGPNVTDIDRRLSEASARLTGSASIDEHKALLDIMLALGAEIERIATATNYRFGAVRAYYDLVERRIDELREGRTPGLQPLGQFLLRRLTPAIHTCESLRNRQETLSRRLARVGTLLRSRVELDLAEQNRALLASMERRSKVQLRLQRTVEGLSVVAITYYSVGLVGYMAKGAIKFGLPVMPEVALAVSVPIVGGLVWILVRRIRHALTRD